MIVADFTLLREHAVFTGELFHPRKLPLDLRHAAPDDVFGTQVRPQRPLGQYQLRAAVRGYAVDLRLYFGTARPSQTLLASAQRQLERLVVAPAEARHRVEPPRALALQPSAAEGTAASRIVDRTFRCALSESGGIPKIEVSVAAGLRQKKRFNHVRPGSLRRRALLAHRGFHSGLAAAAGDPQRRGLDQPRTLRPDDRASS